jgi:hypothetical protein
LTIDASGNVGIGTPNPTGKVEIVGNWDGKEGALRLGVSSAIRLIGKFAKPGKIEQR